MFTGIVEEMAKATGVSEGKLSLARPASFADISIGSSIAVEGVCLSIIELSPEAMSFDVIGETQNKTTLGSVREGDILNLERALKVSERFDGHIVQGHVEGVGEVSSVATDEQWTVFTVSLPENVSKFVVPKGSITLNGVSLTIAECDGSECSVALIPHTLKHTTLGGLREGDSVNIESDILGRYIHSIASK
jgi:riboflavin synthase